MSVIRNLAAVAASGHSGSAVFESGLGVMFPGIITLVSCMSNLGATDIRFGQRYANELDAEDTSRYRHKEVLSTLGVNCQGPALHALRSIGQPVPAMGDPGYVAPQGLGLIPRDEQPSACHGARRPAALAIDGGPDLATIEMVCL